MAENKSLKEKTNEFTKIHAQLLDAEHYLKLFQDEKLRIERDAKEREDALRLKIDDLQEDNRRLSDLLNDKQEELKLLDGEFLALKDKYEEAIRDSSEFKDDIFNLEKLLKEREAVINELQNRMKELQIQNKDAQEEIESLVTINEKVTKLSDDRAAKEQEYQNELQDMDNKLHHMEMDNEKLIKEIRDKDKELDKVDSTNDLLQRQIADLKNNLSQCDEQIDDRDQKIKDMESQLSELNNHLTIALNKIESNENYIDELSNKIAKAEEDVIRSEGEISRLQKENESLHGLLDRYRNDVEAHKKLREEQALKKYELEQEKKRLEKESKSKEYEVLNTKRKLEEVEGSQEKLMKSQYQLNQEIGRASCRERVSPPV